MLNTEQLQTIEKEVQALLGKMGERAQVSLRQTEEPGDHPTLFVSLKMEEPKMLIGERGQTLLELQHILKLIVRKKISPSFYLSLDVNEYRQNKEEYLRELAHTTADEVVLLKKPKELPPMAAAERRIIHVALAGRGDVVSESVGEGAERRVVIRRKN